MAVAAIGAGVAAGLDYSKKERVDGFLQTRGGDISLVTPAQGAVNVLVEPGQHVKKGQVIAVVTKPERLADGRAVATAQQGMLEKRRESLNRDLVQSDESVRQRVDSLQAQLVLNEQQVRQAQVEIDTRQHLLDIEQAELQRQQSLKGTGFVADSALDKARASVLARQGELQAALRNLTQARTQVAAVRSALAEVKNDAVAQRSALTRAAQDVELQQLESERLAFASVSAPRSGQVLLVAASDGTRVAEGQVIAKLAPEDQPLEALLLLPATAANRVQPGQVVQLQVAAYPFQTYGLVSAEVTQVDAAPVLVQDTQLKELGLQSNALLVKATARITNVPHRIGSLRTGMLLKAAVETERKSFLAWMLWPLWRHFVA